MNAKNETPYIHDEPAHESWVKSKGAKLTAAIVGGIIVLGGTFGAGIAVGASPGGHNLPGIAGFDRDGDHRFPGGDGQRPPRPGDHDGDHGQFNPNQAPVPAPTTQNG